MQILRALAVVGELRVCDLVESLRRQQGRVSADLRILATSGLVWRRRSGVAIYYRLPDEAPHPLPRAATAFLRAIFGHVSARDARKAALADNMRSDSDSDAALIHFFTAFTHVRRLQIIRQLAAKGSSLTFGELSATLHMSGPACTRHLVSLLERSIIVSSPTEGRRTYRFAPSLPDRQATLLDELVTHLNSQRAVT